MAILKTSLTFLIVFVSFIATSQTFILNGSNYIGKTEKEINKIIETNNSKFFSKEDYGSMISITYSDSVNSMQHQFLFARPFHLGPRKCFAYFATTNNTSQFEKTKAGLLAKCEKIISDKTSVQVSGKKKYVWHYSSCSNFLSVEKFRKGRKYK